IFPTAPISLLFFAETDASSDAPKAFRLDPAPRGGGRPRERLSGRRALHTREVPGSIPGAPTQTLAAKLKRLVEPSRSCEGCGLRETVLDRCRTEIDSAN